MPRSIWKGVVSFGMVSIPVKLFSATESKDISFHLLHRACGSRIRQQRWCPVCESEIDWGDTVRGYEYGKDQHVIVTDEDFESLPLPSKHTIELSSFVSDKEIDPVFYEKSYYLEPEEVGAKPFALLNRALRDKGLIAVAKIAIRNKERLCALRPLDGTIMLETLFYPDEVRVEKGAESPAADVSERELTMAFTLIDLLTEPFEPGKYHDDYREALTQVIEAKLQGEEVVAVPAAPPGKAVDLMSALKASVEEARKRREEERAPKAVAGRRKAS
jgi:DNA end-binding protein Ku